MRRPTFMIVAVVSDAAAAPEHGRRGAPEGDRRAGRLVAALRPDHHSCSGAKVSTAPSQPALLSELSCSYEVDTFAIRIRMPPSSTETSAIRQLTGKLVLKL